MSEGSRRVRVVDAPSRAATSLATGALVVLASVGTSLMVLSTTSQVADDPPPAASPGSFAAPRDLPRAVVVVPPRPGPTRPAAEARSSGTFAGEEQVAPTAQEAALAALSFEPTEAPAAPTDPLAGVTATDVPSLDPATGGVPLLPSTPDVGTPLPPDAGVPTKPGRTAPGQARPDQTPGGLPPGLGPRDPVPPVVAARVHGQGAPGDGARSAGVEFDAPAVADGCEVGAAAPPGRLRPPFSPPGLPVAAERTARAPDELGSGHPLLRRPLLLDPRACRAAVPPARPTAPALTPPGKPAQPPVTPEPAGRPAQIGTTTTAPALPSSARPATPAQPSRGAKPAGGAPPKAAQSAKASQAAEPATHGKPTRPAKRAGR